MALTVNVRLGEPADEDAIVEAMRQMHGLGESGFLDSDGKPYPFSEAKVRAAVRAGIERLQSWVGIAEVDGAVGGIAMLALCSPFYSDASYLAEQTLFVLPEYRRTRCASKLLTFAKDLSTALKVPLAIGIMSGRRLDAKEKFYARALGQPASGSLFLHHPPTS